MVSFASLGTDKNLAKRARKLGQAGLALVTNLVTNSPSPTWPLLPV